MKAIRFYEFGGPERLQLETIESPQPAPSEVLVEVKAAGVNPVDWKIREGYLSEVLPHQFPIIPGWDAAGVVRSCGIGVTSLEPGDDIWSYCRRDIVQQGAYSEYMVLPEHLAAKKPENLSFEQAAAIPLAGLTAYQALFEAGNLQAGQTVLIHAAAGGVGHLAVQLAKQSGARVIGTAGSSNHDFVKQLGADVMIDYHEQNVNDAVKAECPDGVDCIFDCVGSESAEQSAEVLAGNGRFVTIVNLTGFEDLKREGIDARAVFVRPDREQLNRLRAMAENSKLRVHIEESFPLESAAEAQNRSQAGHVRGKLVLV